MPFYFYDENGNQFKTNNAVDRNTAIRTGKYFIDPPGTIKEEIVELEDKTIAEGISPIEKEEKIEEVKGEDNREGKEPEEKKSFVKMKRGGN